MCQFLEILGYSIFSLFIVLIKGFTQLNLRSLFLIIFKDLLVVNVNLTVVLSDLPQSLCFVDRQWLGEGSTDDLVFFQEQGVDPFQILNPLYHIPDIHLLCGFLSYLVYLLHFIPAQIYRKCLEPIINHILKVDKKIETFLTDLPLLRSEQSLSHC